MKHVRLYMKGPPCGVWSIRLLHMIDLWMSFVLLLRHRGNFKYGWLLSFLYLYSFYYHRLSLLLYFTGGIGTTRTIPRSNSRTCSSLLT